MKAFSVFVLALQCGTAFAQHTVTLNLEGLTPHLGQLFKARMVETSSGRQVAETTLTALPGSRLTLVFPGESGKSYNIDYFADSDGDKAYTAPPADHAWRKPAGPLHHQGIILDAAHDSDYTDIQYPNVAVGLRFADRSHGTRSNAGGIEVWSVFRHGYVSSGTMRRNILGRAAFNFPGALVNPDSKAQPARTIWQ